VLHSTYTHRNQVDSRLLVVGSQIAILTPDPSFAYNLCYKCPNGSCEAILDIYTPRPFQRYKEHLNERCFDPCNRVLRFWELGGLPSPIFGSVSGDLTLPSKWGCDTNSCLDSILSLKVKIRKGQGVGARSLIHNISREKGRVGVPGWGLG